MSDCDVAVMYLLTRKLEWRNSNRFYQIAAQPLSSIDLEGKLIGVLLRPSSG